ncbi:DUF2721 domain-containing protein [Sphingomonas sp. DT-51]|uniref:DUF2721 domain-containing protein n=1 Tax=Sphingomonas sp. DT-51 TaxID=3396165 RepID=UPI003F1DDD78
MTMTSPASLTNVVETIRVAVAPVFLLTGLAALLGVMTGRLARIIDRARLLGDRPVKELPTDQQSERRILPARIRLIRRAILLAAMSALALCLVIVLLFVASLVDLHIGVAAALMFITAMLLLMGALACFIAEIRLALTIIYVAADDH